MFMQDSDCVCQTRSTCQDQGLTSSTVTYTLSSPAQSNWLKMRMYDSLRTTLTGFHTSTSYAYGFQTQTVVVHGMTEQSIVPAPGDIVTAMVTLVNQRFCKCTMKCIGDVVLTRSYRGILRKEDVRATEKDRVELYKSFRPGDIILARVVSFDFQSDFCGLSLKVWCR